MNTNKHELKFSRMKRLSRWMIMLPVAAVIMAIVVFILEGFPYPGRSGFSHSLILAEQLTPGLAIFDILYLIVLILFLITLIPSSLYSLIEVFKDTSGSTILYAFTLRILCLGRILRLQIDVVRISWRTLYARSLASEFHFWRAC